jgi:hypothetical protein
MGWLEKRQRAEPLLAGFRQNSRGQL